jgi:hypothetical protein
MPTHSHSYRPRQVISYLASLSGVGLLLLGIFAEGYTYKSIVLGIALMVGGYLISKELQEAVRSNRKGSSTTGGDMGFRKGLFGGTSDSTTDLQDQIAEAQRRGDDQTVMALAGQFIAAILQRLPPQNLTALRNLDTMMGRQFLSTRLVTAFQRGWRQNKEQPLHHAGQEIFLEIDFLLKHKPSEILLKLADRINDYFANAVTVFLELGDSAARTAALAAAKVADTKQRASMVRFLRGIAGDWKETRGVQDEAHDNFQALADEIESRDWRIEDIQVQKALLGEVDMEYLHALDGFDPTIFIHRYPHLFGGTR